MWRNVLLLHYNIVHHHLTVHLTTHSTTGDATGLEALLSATTDRYVGWYGTPRTEAWYDRNQKGQKQLQLAVLQAAVTALMGGYYVTRMGPECESPYHSYGPSKPGSCSDSCMHGWPKHEHFTTKYCSVILVSFCVVFVSFLYHFHVCACGSQETSGRGGASGIGWTLSKPLKPLETRMAALH